MTIDEAIEHAEEVARTCDDSQCAKDHAQLADWLRELRRARMEIDLLKTLRDGFKADAQKYKAENAKLREKYYEYESKMDSLVHRLTGGLLSKSAAMPNDALYSATMEQMTDELIGENFKLESENKKLRDMLGRYIRQAHLLAYDKGNPLAVGIIEEDARDLGIEVR